MAVASDDASPPQKAADDRVAQILKEWHRRSAATTSLDVRFQLRRTSRFGLNSPEPATGRVVLLPEGRALVETVTHNAARKSTETERLLWTKDALHCLVFESKTHHVTPIAAKDKGRLPAVLAIPFLWGVTPEALTAKYRVALLKEDRETLILSFTPLFDKDSPKAFQAFLLLDRATYLPRRYVAISGADSSKSKSDYSVTEIRRNQPIADEAMRLPQGDLLISGWAWPLDGTLEPLDRIFHSLFGPDYLP
jgi:hypothetical protein